jgi:hypothetical protein
LAISASQTTGVSSHLGLRARRQMEPNSRTESALARSGHRV